LNYIIFDLEATCEDRSINPYWDNETIEIGAVKINNNEIIDSISIFIKPIENPILTNFCKNLTHISQEDVVRHDSQRLARAVFRLALRSTLRQGGRKFRRRLIRMKEIEL